LSKPAQRLIRKWTLSDSERRSNRRRTFGNEYTGALSNNSTYNDQARHQQLLNGTTRFCCRTLNQKVHFRSSATSFGRNLWPLFIPILILV
jgi:hypothetical protein